MVPKDPIGERVEFPRLFDRTAFPELDLELERKLAEYGGRKVMVVVHVRILHNNFPSEIYVMYLFSKKTEIVLGIKHAGTPATVDEQVEFGRTIANFYSRNEPLEVIKLEHRFATEPQWSS